MNIKNAQWVYVIGQTFSRENKRFFYGLDFVRSYVDDLLIISNKPLVYCIQKLGKAGFKVNEEKSCFVRNESNI